MRISTRLRHALHVLHRLAIRALAASLCCYLATGCDGSLALLIRAQTPEPEPGLRDHQSRLLVGVPGGVANVAGGNLFVRAPGLSLDTALGGEVIEPVYNSATGEWRFGSVAMHYDGATFVDPTGAVYATAPVADGGALPGSVWIVVDGDTLRTKDGLVFEFDTQGALAAKHRLGQECPRIVYEGAAAGPAEPLVIRQQDCGARGEWSSYNTVLFTLDRDAAGRIEAVTDRAGRAALYTWAASGHLLSARDGLDVEQGWPGTRYDYDALYGRLAGVTASEGERVEYAWYAPAVAGTPRLQLATQVAQAGEGSLRYRFDYLPGAAEGMSETVVTDPPGDTRRFRFDDLRRVHAIAHEAVGEIEAFGYAGAELRPAEFTPANGATERYTRDAGGDILSIRQASGNVVEHVYADANGPFRNHRALAAKWDSLGALGSWAYTQDAPVDYGRLAAATNGAGETTRFAWHPGGGYTRLASVTLPSGVVQAFDGYDALGHPTRIQHGPLVGSAAYDAVGNRTRGSDGSAPEDGGVLERRFDVDRNPVEVMVADTEGQTAVIRLPRGSDGRILFVDRPPLGLGAGPDHRFGYDTLGRAVVREERVDGVWQATTFEYDGRGMRTAENLPNGMRRERAYDQRGRITVQRAYRDGVLEGEVRFHYAGGQLVAVDDSARGVETYAYDFAGRLAAVHYAGGEAVEYAYDLRSRVVKETYRLPDASVAKEIGREYDGADREVGILDDGEPVLERSYADGRLDCIETANALTRCFHYDPAVGLRDGAVTTDAAQEVVETTTLVAGPTQNPALWEAHAETDVAGLGSVAAHFSLGPGTDPAVPGSEVGKRLLSWNDGDAAAQVYAYDGLSNPVDDADGDVYDYNPEGNRLLGANVGGVSVAYTWDAAGFAASRDGVPIAWTALGRLAAYGPIAIEWDMRGRPLRASDTGGGPPAVRDWSRWGGRIEVDADGFLVALDLGEAVLGFGQGRRYRHFDFRGNSGFVSDDSGKIVTLYGYAPTGIHRVLGDGSDPTRFVGRSAAGPFLWLGERMLDPLVGRFLSPDPVFNLMNQYTYTLGNPVWFSDPTGREGENATAVDVGIAALAMTVAAVSIAATVAAGTPLGVALSVFSLGFSIYGFARSLGAGAPTPTVRPPDNVGCDCAQTLTFSVDMGETESPAGAAPSGRQGDGGGAVSAVVASAAGFGGAIGGFGGVAGGFGGAPACGLTGIEFLVLVGYALNRKRRRTR